MTYFVIHPKYVNVLDANHRVQSSHDLVREGIKKIDFFLGKSPKLWVGGVQES